MKKLITTALAAAVLCSVVSAGAIYVPGAPAPAEGMMTILSAPANEPKVIAEGTELTAPAYEKDGVFMIPLRAACEALGYAVEWIPATGGVAVTKGDYETTLKAGDNLYLMPRDRKYLNRTRGFALSVAPECVGPVTYVPAEFFVKILGYSAAVSGGEVRIAQKITLGEETTSVMLRKGADFAIELRGNPSTGYSWTNTVAEGVIIRGDEVVADANMPGSPATYVWSLQAVSEGVYAFDFRYERAWNSDEPARTVEFIVTVI